VSRLKSILKQETTSLRNQIIEYETFDLSSEFEIEYKYIKEGFGAMTSTPDLGPEQKTLKVFDELPN
jgi:hypothetical protein